MTVLAKIISQHPCGTEVLRTPRLSSRTVLVLRFQLLEFNIGLRRSVMSHDGSRNVVFVSHLLTSPYSKGTVLHRLFLKHFCQRITSLPVGNPLPTQKVNRLLSSPTLLSANHLKIVFAPSWRWPSSLLMLESAALIRPSNRCLLPAVCRLRLPETLSRLPTSLKMSTATFAETDVCQHFTIIRGSSVKA
jgi:hypothetical protein